MARVGFIGLGRMGKPMARRLLQAGHDLMVWNRSPGPTAELAVQGAGVVDDVAALAGRVDVLFTCVTTPGVVADILCGPSGVLASARPGCICVDCSTIGVADARRIAAQLAEKGIGFLDAPVSGGPWGAAEGTLTVMVGGNPEHLAAVRPYVEAFSRRIYHLGATGAGQAAKLCNNLLVGIHTLAAAEAFVLGVKAGLDAEQLFELISGATGSSAQINRHLPKFVLPGDFTAAFSIEHLHKDVGLAGDLARAEGVRLLLGSLAAQLTGEALSQGLGHLDISALFRPLELLADAEVRGRSGGSGAE